MTFPRPFVVPEVLEVQVVPSDEVRIVPEKPTTTKVLFPYATALRLFEVPEVCAVQFAPSDEVSKVPSAPTATNNPLDVVVVLSVVVLLVLLLVSLFLAQEIMGLSFPHQMEHLGIIGLQVRQ